MHFQFAAPEGLDYAVNRYRREAERHYQVLNDHLAIDDGTEKVTAELLDLVPVDYAAQRCDNPIRASRLVGDTTAL